MKSMVAAAEKLSAHTVSPARSSASYTGDENMKNKFIKINLNTLTQTVAHEIIAFMMDNKNLDGSIDDYGQLTLERIS